MSNDNHIVEDEPVNRTRFGSAATNTKPTNLILNISLLLFINGIMRYGLGKLIYYNLQSKD